ncbi:hypothetical protein COW36_04120 [bacterium (Candidatus Blackallbacteria) CG17_big_fil_post_rev_8_21_14_2_50_48_46]|uniref:Uncharacterized protein n=1 Tax=bacterium (Candidatus Blackallbacteria) CG17_big_fil_post_rev_8_21_14_2_50_48_46 TaxID=2014261 RepID=A0A2M7G9E8_9BACT|nr:MAG: hypothetical protein COW64_04825 [bacterium (Candidatus Blackallbacteria) CG18_big_fil_WC_8_21_14_2_50_49_26]PIW18484.1 MAG: hypothetical protein COW36_04120 [bacterium (Candidatus Blackallbacteria) CG17_big_fil_post_rev_8_21_14_2_50_48_46]PIW46531.1 MAG: hypothetical protein COW20_16560 [bacterium (Candidatus Blackallbacteria) CG13_big_fil_rev_8_21_14_2_50_49_14]
MVESLSSQVASQTLSSTPAGHTGWLNFFAFLITMSLVAGFTWLITGRYRKQETIIEIYEDDLPAIEQKANILPQTANEEIELWRSRLEHLYLDVPAVDPRQSEDT